MVIISSLKQPPTTKMSQSLFTKTPLLRVAPRRAIQQQFQAGYHSSTSSKMPSGSQQLRTMIRQTTLRASTLAAQRSSFPISQQFYSTQQPSRPRSPSPPPPYQARNITVRAATGQWTRFNTPHSLSSVRTFTSSPKIQWPAESAQSALSPETQKRVDAAIEEIQELYGTAKDEFEIASEETEKNTTYAPDDREAAREELDKLLEYYRGVVDGADKTVGDEVRRRVGGRIRELENAVVAMEEAALHGD